MVSIQRPWGRLWQATFAIAATVAMLLPPTPADATDASEYETAPTANQVPPEAPGPRPAPVQVPGARSGPQPAASGETMSAKIRLDLSGVNQDGLAGPPDGLRALAYEFCIPARPEAVAEVRAIDPSNQVFPNSRGRIGCTSDQYLAIGSTHQPGYRAVLARLADLDYVERIDPSYGE